MGNRRASIICKTKCEFLKIDREHFFKIREAVEREWKYKK